MIDLEALNDSVRERIRYMDIGADPVVPCSPKFVDISGDKTPPGYVDLFAKYWDLEFARRKREFIAKRRGGYSDSLL